MLQFAVETDCLDNTVLQAVHLLDTYLRNNPMIHPRFIRVISAISLEISIKLNEHMSFTFEEISQSFDEEFSIEMLIQLESHILQLNKFKLNVPTPLDYALHFVFIQVDEFKTFQFALTPQELITLALPIIHYSMSQYSISRKKYISIALASICHVLQEVHSQIREEYLNSNEETTKSDNSLSMGKMLNFHERFLKNLFEKFPNKFDLEEIWGIVQDLNKQSIKVNTQFLNFEDNLSEIHQEKHVTDDIQSLDGEPMAISDEPIQHGSKQIDDQRLLVIADNDSCYSDENKDKGKRKMRERAKKEALVAHESLSEHDLDQAGSEIDDFEKCNFVGERNDIDQLNPISFRSQDHIGLKAIMDHQADLHQEDHAWLRNLNQDSHFSNGGGRPIDDLFPKDIIWKQTDDPSSHSYLSSDMMSNSDEVQGEKLEDLQIPPLPPLGDARMSNFALTSQTTCSTIPSDGYSFALNSALTSMASQLGIDKRNVALQESDDDEPYVVTKRIRTSMVDTQKIPKMGKSIMKTLPTIEKQAKSSMKLVRAKTLK